MALFSLHLPAERSAVAKSADSARLHPGFLFVAATLASFALSWPHLLRIWHTGTFFDTDDAMRAVQVRDWLAGQSWFDLTAHRIGQHGLLMHWSRVVDVPLGALMRLFGSFTDPATAERLTRIVFPLALQAALIAAVMFAARVLCGMAAVAPAAFLATTGCIQFGQFVAGRIDHHAPQITLLVLMAGLAADVLLHQRARSAALAAVCMAGSLAISLENLPFIAVTIAALALAWGFGGASYGRVLRLFGLSLGASALLAFAATVPPSRYFETAIDAYSLPHLLAVTLGGLTLAIFPTALPRMRLWARLVALIVGGAGVMAIVLLCCPAVLASPFANIDPFLHDIWLTHVSEAQPLTTVLHLHPQAATLILGPLLAGLAAILVAAIREQGARRGTWLFLGALVAAAVAGSVWEIRILGSGAPIALFGGVYAWTAAQHLGSRLPLRALILVPFAPMAWIVVPVPDEEPAVAQSTDAAALCREAETLTPLAALGKGIIFAPIDSGSHLLATTDLTVLAAPYHRNNVENRLVVEGFAAPPASAEEIVKASGARYVALCPGQVQGDVLRDRYPDGLAAALLNGRTPNWLASVDLPGTRYKVFAVR